jgi:transposase
VITIADPRVHDAPILAFTMAGIRNLYNAWRNTLASSMRQIHRAGEKLFVDYSGKRPRIADPVTGEVTDVELFVAVLGASNYTYVEATRTQKKADFVASTIRALEYFGGVPELLVPDQLRSAVSGPDRYDPEINPTYLELAQHYGFAVIPARPAKPRDKGCASHCTSSVGSRVVSYGAADRPRVLC